MLVEISRCNDDWREFESKNEKNNLPTRCHISENVFKTCVSTNNARRVCTCIRMISTSSSIVSSLVYVEV